MIYLCLHSVVTLGCVDEPVAVAELLAQWSDRMAAEHTTGQLDHHHATVGRQQQYSFTCNISEREAKYLMNYDVLSYV